MYTVAAKLKWHEECQKLARQLAHNEGAPSVAEIRKETFFAYPFLCPRYHERHSAQWSASWNAALDENELAKAFEG